MPVKTEREYRKAQEFRADEEGQYIVEGYASTFDPYVMWEEDGVKYYERIDKKAFDDANMDDVIMQFDHEGRVYARNKNGTLQLSTDDHGLKIRADLSKTEGSRQLYEDIRAGLIDQMSFAFTVSDEAYESDTRTRVIKRIKKLYDVSAVSIPANPGTEISARSYFEGVIEAERLEEAKREELSLAKAKLKLKLEVVK